MNRYAGQCCAVPDCERVVVCYEPDPDPEWGGRRFHFCAYHQPSKGGAKHFPSRSRIETLRNLIKGLL